MSRHEPYVPAGHRHPLIATVEESSHLFRPGYRVPMDRSVRATPYNFTPQHPAESPARDMPDTFICLSRPSAHAHLTGSDPPPESTPAVRIVAPAGPSRDAVDAPTGRVPQVGVRLMKGWISAICAHRTLFCSSSRDLPVRFRAATSPSLNRRLRWM